jgi:hypothetical protein
LLQPAELPALAPAAAKHFLVLRTVFNIAHTGAAHLGDAWHIVYEVCDHLDRLLAAGVSPNLLLPADLVFLTNSLASLPKLSKQLDAAALLCMVSAAIRLSTSGVSQAPPRLFALQQLVAIAQHNQDRIQTIWAPLSDHLLLCADNRKDAVRQAAGEALAGFLPTSFAQSAPSGAEPPQRAYLETLQRLVLCSYSDSRHRALVALNSILQSSGHVSPPSLELATTLIRPRSM